jgi:hypothetical protein
LHLRDGVEQVGIQNVHAQAHAKSFNERILVGLVRLDEQQLHTVPLSPFCKTLDVISGPLSVGMACGLP